LSETRRVFEEIAGLLPQKNTTKLQSKRSIKNNLIDLNRLLQKKSCSVAAAQDKTKIKNLCNKLIAFVLQTMLNPKGLKEDVEHWYCETQTATVLCSFGV